MRPTAHRAECKADGSPSWAGQPGQQAIIKNFPVAQRVKRLSAMQETRVRSLGQEEPLEKEMATRSSTTAWKIAWTEEPSRLQSIASLKKQYWLFFSTLCNITFYREGPPLR